VYEGETVGCMLWLKVWKEKDWKMHDLPTPDSPRITTLLVGMASIKLLTMEPLNSSKSSRVIQAYRVPALHLTIAFSLFITWKSYAKQAPPQSAAAQSWKRFEAWKKWYLNKLLD